MYSFKKYSWKKDATILFFIFVTFVFLIWKCRYGIANIDESFYLTIPFRLCNGDALLVDEWNLAQMAGLLTTPIVWLYMITTNSLDGVVLFMRYFYVIIQCIIAIFFYFRFRKLSWLGASFASLSFFLYAPFGIMALSYNSMAIMGLVLCLTFVGPAEKNDQYSKVNYILAGISFSASVLCCPYLVLVYIGYILAVVVRKLKSQGNPPLHPIFDSKGAVSFSVGILLSVLAFAVFVFWQGAWGDILKSLLYILDDPSHPPASFITSTVIYIYSVFFKTTTIFISYVCLGVLFLILLLDKKRKTRKLIYFSVSSALALILLFLYIRLNYINLLMWAINALGIFVAVLSDKKSTRVLFYTFWISGILYSFCSNWASNQSLYAITSASTVSTVGSIMMIILFVDECLGESVNKWQKRVMIAITILLISTQLISQIVFRYKSVFWEKEGMLAQTEYIDSGVQSGLYVSKEKISEYDKMYSRINLLKKFNAESAVFITKDTRYYLYGEYNIGAFSAWLGKLTPQVLERLWTYYDVNPEKLPDIGYIEISSSDVDVVSIAETFSKAYGYEWFYDADGIVLTKNNSM